MDNKESITGRTLIVSQQTHKALSWLKLEGDYKSIDEVINKLLRDSQALKNLGEQREKKANGSTKKR